MRRLERLPDWWCLAVRATAGVLMLLAGSAPVVAQENFEIQVYGAETMKPGNTMLELHTNTAVQGTTRTTDGVRRTQGAWHETLELTHGFTPWFETGFYLFTSIQPDTSWEWVGDHIRPRLRVPESWDWPVGLSLSAEAGYQRREFSTDTWTIELRPIIDQTLGKFYWSINPTLGFSLEGQNAGKAPDFAPAVKISYEVLPKVSAGIEYYGSVGPVNHFDAARDQQHQLFPVIDIDFGPQWEFNVGVGFGLTPATDSLIVKMILGYRFNF
jgi:outer membrane putative beta-barrel porin/alpha-amylase